MHHRTLGSLGVALSLSVGLAGQTPTQLPGSAMPGPASRQQPPLAPPRDNTTVQTRGTARVTGRVVSADTGAPLRNAPVHLGSPEGRVNLGATTDADGRYEFLDLPEGSYFLSASKPGYVDQPFGQVRPYEPGKSIPVGEGQRLDKIDFALLRGGIIVGKITDEFGEPAVGVRVQAMRFVYTSTGRDLSYGFGSSAGNATDDLGQFRLYGLRPGDYVVSATPGMSPTVSMGMNTSAGGQIVGRGRSDGFITTYYPGTTNTSDAQTVSVQAAHETPAYFSIASGRLTRVAGVVRTSQGRPLAGAMLSVRTSTNTMVSNSTGGTTGPDGSFSLWNLTPGEHVLEIRSRSAGLPPIPGSAVSGPTEPEFASIPIVADGTDISGLVITTGPGVTVSGRVILHGNAALARRPAAFRVMLTSPPSTRYGLGPVQQDSPGNGAIDESGRFQIRGVMGRALFRPAIPSGWALRSVTLEGVDITDVPIDITRNVGGVEIVLTDRVTNVSGVIRKFGGELAREAFAIVVPASLREGAEPARFLQMVRQNAEGRYSFRGLPPGDYHVAAVESLEPGRQFDPAFQQELKLRGNMFRLAEGQTLSLDLQLIQ